MVWFNFEFFLFFFKIDRRVAPILGLRPRLDHAGSDVRLTITSTCLKLTSLETGAVIAVHDMPNISFASGGDAVIIYLKKYVNIKIFILSFYGFTMHVFE